MNIQIKDEVKTKPAIAKPIKRKKKLGKLVFWIIALIVVAAVGYAGYRALEFSNNVGVKINPGDIINNIKNEPELKRDSSKKYTTALIVGIDARSAKSTLQNTDSMIIATYNWDTKNITMISLPRDLYVKVPNENWYTKVNGLYAHGEILKKGNGMSYLASAITGITGVEIQYKAMVDLQGFRKIIDAVGGVTVNVENTFTDYQYPTESRSKPVYETVTFKKGPQTMDGKTALKYARSRHSQGIEGSDFMRARRQQKVIDALKTKAMSSETLLNPQKIMEIMAAIQDNVQLYGIEMTDIQAGINLAREYQKNPGHTYHFVLDPSFGDYKVINRITVGNLYAIGPVAGNGNYTQIKALTKLCLSRPALYSTKPIVRIYDVGMGTNAKTVAAEIKAKYPYINIAYMGKLTSGQTGMVVYAHSSGFKDAAVEVSKGYTVTATTQPDYVKTNLNKENITILLGKTETTQSTN